VSVGARRAAALAAWAALVSLQPQERQAASLPRLSELLLREQQLVEAPAVVPELEPSRLARHRQACSPERGTVWPQISRPLAPVAELGVTWSAV
jgi:hypothetical protein